MAMVDTTTAADFIVIVIVDRRVCPLSAGQLKGDLDTWKKEYDTWIFITTTFLFRLNKSSP
jgi:hypothetical protein